MNAVYILILLVLGNGSGVAMQEFYTKDACEAALAKTKTVSIQVWGTCVPKTYNGPPPYP